MKKAAEILLPALAVFFLFLTCVPAHAEVVIDDEFSDTAMVDLAKTTARVDTVNHCVLLPLQSLTGAVEMIQNGTGYAVASKAGIVLYEFDDAAGRMAQNPAYSCPWASDATGVSIRQDNLNLWAVSGSSLAYYRFNGAGLSNDPALKISGLTGVLSVAAFKNSDSALLLQSAGNKARVTRYDAGSGLSPELLFQPDITDPVKVCMVNSSPDFVLFSKTAAYYFSYDEAGGTYIEDPARRVTGLVDVISAGSDEVGSSVLTGTGLDYYMNDEAGGAARVEMYSPGTVEGAVAVALKPGASDQVLLDQNGNLQWWAYDDSSGRMARDTGLEVSGPVLNSGYAHPRIYSSKAVSTVLAYDAARLTVTEDKPAGTSISYAVSPDGGVTFVDTVPGAWTAVPKGVNFVARAALDTADPGRTPKILRLTLDLEDDLVLEGIINPRPAERGGNVSVSARAVSLTTGSVAPLDSCTVKYPLETKFNGDPALAEGQTPTVAAMAFNPGTGYWEYIFTIPEKHIEGRWPDDGVYQLGLAGVREGRQKEIRLLLEVSGNLLNRLIIRTISW